MAPGPASPCSVLMPLMNPWLGWLLALTDVFSCCSALLRTRLSRFFSGRQAAMSCLCSFEAGTCLGSTWLLSPCGRGVLAE